MEIMLEPVTTGDSRCQIAVARYHGRDSFCYVFLGLTPLALCCRPLRSLQSFIAETHRLSTSGACFYLPILNSAKMRIVKCQSP
jgi:hypothetical protein